MEIPLKYFEEVKGRTCGACTACCTWLGIEELKKFTGVKCKHLRGPAYTNKRCGIYPSRPVACKEYWCMWLSGWGEDDWKPQQCGILVTVYPGKNNPEHISVTMNVFDEAKSKDNVNKFIGQLVMIPVLEELRVINIQSKKALVFKDGKIYKCHLLKPEDDDYEGLLYAAEDQPIGKYSIENRET